MRKKMLAAVGVLAVLGLLFVGILLGMQERGRNPAESGTAEKETEWAEDVNAAGGKPVQMAMPDAGRTPDSVRNTGTESEEILDSGAASDATVAGDSESGAIGIGNPEGSAAVEGNPWNSTVADGIQGNGTVVQNAENDIGDSVSANGEGITGQSAPEGIFSSTSDAGREEVSCESSSEPEQQNHEHRFEKIYWYGAPSCVTVNNYYNLICSVCGENGGTGSDTVPHTPQIVESESREGCIRYRILEGTCLVCGITLDRQVLPIGEEHDMITGQTGPVWDETLQDFVTHTVTYCSCCGLTDN